MCVLLNGVVIGPCQSEISEFDGQVIAIDENVLRLEIPVQDSIGMAIVEGEKELKDDRFNLLLAQTFTLHKLLQITVGVLEHQLQLVFP